MNTKVNGNLDCLATLMKRINKLLFGMFLVEAQMTSYNKQFHSFLHHDPNILS